MPTPRLLAAASLLLATVALSGCAELTDQLRNESSKTFESADELHGNWGKEAPWVPADAADITIRENVNAPAAILGFSSATPLDDSCVETKRQSGPAFAQDWVPDWTTQDSVFVCDEWAVMPTDDGYFAWTPIDPDEQEATAAK